MYLYGIYNNLNGKIYVGVTNNLNRRWSEHKKCGKKLSKYSYAIHHAMHKYGIENFAYKHIDDASSLEEALEKEVKWIKELKLYGYKLYNETEGGEGSRGRVGFKMSDAHRKLLSKINSGSGNPMYGVRRYGKDNYNYGKKIKPHVKEILLKIRSKLQKSQVEEIQLLYKEGNHSQKQLSELYNISIVQINRIINGKRWKNI